MEPSPAMLDDKLRKIGDNQEWRCARRLEKIWRRLHRSVLGDQPGNIGDNRKYRGQLVPCLRRSGGTHRSVLGTSVIIGKYGSAPRISMRISWKTFVIIENGSAPTPGMRPPHRPAFSVLVYRPYSPLAGLPDILTPRCFTCHILPKRFTDRILPKQHHLLHSLRAASPVVFYPSGFNCLLPVSRIRGAAMSWQMKLHGYELFT